jgi:hypothetical protein
MDEIGTQLARRRDAAARAWELGDELVLIAAGDPIPIPGRGDPTYPFKAHSEYLYLTDRNRPGGVLAFDPAEGWHDFVAPVTAEEMLWEGASPGETGGSRTPSSWSACAARRPPRGPGSPRCAS